MSDEQNNAPDVSAVEPEASGNAPDVSALQAQLEQMQQQFQLIHLEH